MPQIQFRRYPALGERRLRRLLAIIREYLDCLDSGRSPPARLGRAACKFCAGHVGHGQGDNPMAG
ncbi:MAG TPA: hypothetical protein VHC22_01980 [Pirellulales bacterium]|nr:hypothetical protein [Pirellulales bacterium]